MFDEEEKPKPKQVAAQPLKLDDMSVDAMREYIAWLDQEKSRVEAEVAKRAKVKNAAEAFFKS